jgi:NitT/TauT family transport system substrate-binding protein
LLLFYPKTAYNAASEKEKRISMKNKAFLCFLCLLSLTSVFGQNHTLRLAIGYIPHVQFAPLYAGMEKGFYAAENIDLDIEYGFGVDIFSLLAAGKIDIGLSDSDQLLIAGAKGMDLRAIFQYYQKYPVTIVAKAGTIKTPGDFAGKTIGTPELYGTSYIGLRIFLEKFGLRDSVKIERIGYTQISSLLSDRIDGAVCFYNNEPLQFRDRNTPIVQWDVKDFSDIVGAAFISSEKILNEKAGILRAFVRATKRAVQYTAEHPGEAYEIAGRFIGHKDTAQAEFMKKVLAATTTLFESAGGYGFLDEKKYQESIELLFRLGIINRVFPAAAVLRDLR